MRIDIFWLLFSSKLVTFSGFFMSKIFNCILTYQLLGCIESWSCHNPVKNMLILFRFCYFTNFIRHSTTLPSDLKCCFAFHEKWLLASPCYSAFVLSNTFSTQGFAKYLNDGLNLSSLLKAFVSWGLSFTYTAQRWVYDFWVNIYKIWDSSSSDLSSLRFPHTL